MLDWISSNGQNLDVLINLGMLFVWIAYLQIFILGYRRQRRATILINFGSGSGLETHCLISNMSSEAIYVQSLIVNVEVEGGGDRFSAAVTELDGLETWEGPSDLSLWTRQGPLRSGEVRDMGSFRSMLEHVLSVRARSRGGEAADAAQIAAIEVIVGAVYASEDLLVGAQRNFRIIEERGTLRLQPHLGGTSQIRSRRQRRALEMLLENG